MNPGFCTYVVQHFEALNCVGSENIVKRSGTLESIELLVNVDGLKVTSIFDTSVSFANISKHLVFQGRIFLPCLLFLFS